MLVVWYREYIVVRISLRALEAAQNTKAEEMRFSITVGICLGGTSD